MFFVLLLLNIFDEAEDGTPEATLEEIVANITEWYLRSLLDEMFEVVALVQGISETGKLDPDAVLVLGAMNARGGLPIVC